MEITKNHVVTIDFTLKDDQGTVLDSSKDNGPLTYLHGHGSLIPALEAQVEGKKVGDNFKVDLKTDEAYGERTDELIQAVPKEEVPGEDLEVGMQFQADSDQGPLLLTVVEIKDTEVVLDGNHPLAGMGLCFDVTVSNIREATEEEITHGHVHGEGGVQH